MKHIKIILGLVLLTATIQTFAQSPRIKLNQITKDSLTGSVLISSPTDSGMVYSRDLFISYGADTFLILGGDTLAATSSIISSVLSDGVTITGDGTIGSELTVDTATVIATKQDLDLYYLDSNPDGYTSNTGTVTSVGGTGTVNGISLSGTVTSSGNLTLGGTLSGVDLTSQVTGTLPVANGGTGSATQNFVDLTNAQTVGGAKTFTSALTQSGGNVNFDSGTLFVDATNNRVGIGTSTPLSKLEIDGGQIKVVTNNLNANIGFGAANGTTGYTMGLGITANTQQYVIYDNSGGAARMLINSIGDVGIGTTIPSEKLDVDGNARFRSIGSGASAGALHYTSTGVLTTNTSDVRLKTNLQPLENTLQKLLDINTYTFNWINETDRVDLGMVAQEVEEIFPRLVFTNPVDGYKGIHYDKFSSILTKAIQEQQAIIESIQTELDAKSSIIESQSTEIETLKTIITELSNRLQILENN